MPFAALTPEIACAALKAAGLALDPEQVHIEAREGRWLARLPGQRLAWFAASTAGHASLATERRVLRLLEARCTFAVPRVLYEPWSGEYDLRSMVVAGRGDAGSCYDAVRRNPAVAARIGAAIGAILAEQHACVAAREVSDWLPRRPSWPEPRAWIRARLPAVVRDPELCARADAVLRAYEELDVATDDRVLAHTDVAFHNLAIDDSYTVQGLFDFDSAAWVDRHHDFRYLVLDDESFALLDAAAAAYEAAGGRRIDRARVLLYNAACAVSYLAFRAGHEPDERWCGRTLAEDLRWTELALGRV